MKPRESGDRGGHGRLHDPPLIRIGVHGLFEPLGDRTCH